MQAANGTDGIVVPPQAAGDGRFADNIVYFGRTLRKAGLKVGPGAIADAIEAVEVIGMGSREEFHAALFAVFVKRHEDKPVFDEAFRLFWRSRNLVEKMIAMMSPRAPDTRSKDKAKPGESRATDALLGEREDKKPPREEPDIEIDARFTMSGSEVFRRMDFAQMSASEIALAKKALAGLQLPVDRVRTRRFKPSHIHAHVDPRATMRGALRNGGALILPRYRQIKEIQPPLVVLADISGSMSQYTRIFLHFLHVLTEKRRRVHTFLFGTRLTNVSRQMRHKDPDEAMDECAAAVKDWSGGTRIGETLKEFNRLWARRVLGQGAVVLLITDGLEREGTELLGTEMDRLHRSCRRLIWLNPLLRFDGFEPRARGVRAMLPHVDEFRPVHNLSSLSDLAAALGRARPGMYDPRRYLERLKGGA
ncbi:VWA domain-containing protein [Rhizobium sp. AC44/96]|uniref:vWA domain-containing protein n=1 Tax=unclassified Rhizobium TaxID=2613769 RepID=UPI00080FF325|nr:MULTISPECIES: VWA domain-containing protein [unclassified Rhizobium]MDM9623541.1 VWA domain-containing protein [Rhizobium sp. S96]OCJ04222.1 VWA domain-containing protein [Rhizobium sp. AC44/96]